MNKKTLKKGLYPYLILFLIMISIMYILGKANIKVHKLTYDSFMEYVNNGEVNEIAIVPRSRAGIYEIKGTLKNYEESESFILKVPLSNEVVSKIFNAEEKYNFKVDTQVDPESGTFLLFVINILPMLLLIGFAFAFIRK